VDAGGAAAVVAAMGDHAADVEVQRAGCVALWNIAAGSDACRQAVVDAGGAAAVVAAMGAHAALVEVQQDGCGALLKIMLGMCALYDASAELKADREVVLAAVNQNGLALGYASDELRADREVVLAAVKKDGHDGSSLECASAELKADREVVLAAVNQNGLALGYASDELQADLICCIIAARHRYEKDALAVVKRAYTVVKNQKNQTMLSVTVEEMIELCNKLIPAFRVKAGDELFESVDALGKLYYAPWCEGRERDLQAFKRDFDAGEQYIRNKKQNGSASASE